MPQEHFEKLIKKHIKGIKNAYIYSRCSCQQWLRDCERELKNLEESYTEEEKKTDQMYKFEKRMLEKTSSKEYYEKARGRYVKDLEILQNPKSTKKQIFRVFKRHDLSFELNKDATDGSYLLDGLGWYDNYRISDYQHVTHHNAQEAIEWLESYDNGHNIICDWNEGMCQEVRDIITEFFNNFPNGTIHYG